VGHGIRQVSDPNHCAASAAAGALCDACAVNRSMSTTAGHEAYSVQLSQRLPSGDGRGCLKDAHSDKLPAADSTAAPQADGARRKPRRLQHGDPVVQTRAAAQVALGFLSI